MSAVANLEHVTKRYGSTLALEEVDLGIERGKVTALLGPNGAGKTTAISLLLGLASPDAGRVAIFDSPPHRLAARRRVGVMLQTAALPDTLRVRELLRLTSSYYPHPRALAQVAEIAGIAELLKRFYGRLSGGEQRRVQLALALCGNPELLFLDEPTTGLDIEARQRVWSVIRALVAQGSAVLLTTHYLEEAESLADRVVVLVRGRIVRQGTVDEIRALGASRRIRCVSGIAAETVRAWTDVTSVVREGRYLEIEAREAEPVVQMLLATDLQVRELEVHRAGLAEAFVRITRETGP